MSQNRSNAVMQSRIEPHDSLDDFPTPSWGTRAAVEKIIRPNLLPLGTVWEPTCNRGYMTKPLRETFSRVYATDIFDYGLGNMDKQEDFLFPGATCPFDPDWLFFNPPFKAAEEFIARALTFARVGVAALVRTSFLEGQGRYERLYRVRPPTLIYQFTERIILTKGIVRDPDVAYWDPEAIDKDIGKKGVWKKPSTATSYAWLLWVHGMERRPFDWIPPCRKALERPGDYPELAVAA